MFIIRRRFRDAVLALEIAITVLCRDSLETLALCDVMRLCFVPLPRAHDTRRMLRARVIFTQHCPFRQLLMNLVLLKPEGSYLR